MSESGINYDLESQSATKISCRSLSEIPALKEESDKLESDECENSNDIGSPKTDTSLIKNKRIIKKRDDSIKSAPGKTTAFTGNKKSSIPTLKKISPVTSKNTLTKISKVSTRTPSMANRHTLEVQFINKRKRLSSLTKEILEKQKPVMSLYENLIQIKQKLGELGKIVELEDVKFVSIIKEQSKDKEKDLKLESGAGECLSEELVVGMKTSIEEIPRTLLGICQNLLSRRAVIVDLLESVTRAEVRVEDISDKIEALKCEGTELQKSLDLIINEHETKINELVSNWQSLLMDKTVERKDTSQFDDLQNDLDKQKQLNEQSNKLIQELHKKLEDKKLLHERSLSEFDSVIRGLKDQIKKLETEVESERKNTIDHKTRNSVNGQTIKLLKTKICELETKTKEYEDKSSDLVKKLKCLQDSQKTKEITWTKEKEDLSKTIKHQESLLQKLTNDRNQFETRYKHAEKKTDQTEEKMKVEIDELRSKLKKTQITLQDVLQEKQEISEKCTAIEQHMTRMGLDSKREMNEITNNFSWGKNDHHTPEVIEEKRLEIATKLLVAQLQDRIKILEAEKEHNYDVIKQPLVENLVAIDAENIRKNQDVVAKYQQLLEESEEKLREKSMEVAKLTSEIRHLKVRQDALEEQNVVCPTIELQSMVEEGRMKLNELMKKSLESEQKIADYDAIIEKQSKQMSEMENLLRYRDNMTGVLKSSRDELILEKESLTKFSQELRAVLIEVTKEGKLKDRLIKELQEKCEDKEIYIVKLDKEVKELESNLVATNEKRFKLQETICSMEKELQTTKAHVNQLADIQSRYDAGMKYSKPLLENKLSNINITTSSQSLSNAKSLINLSLKKMDLIRTKLNHLSTVDIKFNHERERRTGDHIFFNDKSSKNFNRVLALTSKRCQLLQSQFDKSSEYLSDLLYHKSAYSDKQSKNSSEINMLCQKCKSITLNEDLEASINLKNMPVLTAAALTCEDTMSLSSYSEDKYSKYVK